VRRIFSVALAAVLVLRAPAQSINIDIGTSNPVPASSFGGAAAQAGTWNQVDPASFTPTSLVSISGAPAAASIRRAIGAGMELYADHPTTLGDDGRLLDDADDPGDNSTWAISNLLPGNYVVTTYAWAPDAPHYRTGVVVNGGPQTVVGGPWNGVYVVGLTHAVDSVAIASGQDLVILVSTVNLYASFNGVQVQRLDPSVVSCPGDGSVAPCPCANSGAAGHGCANSTFASGARLFAAGSPSVSADTFLLTGTSLTGNSAVFFQGDALVPPIAIDDGLGCVGGLIVRLGTKAFGGSTSTLPGLGDPLISVRGALPPAGGTRHYQCFYRNTAPLFCPPATSNRTNGVSVTWSP
jgi:hypothetical protein